MAFEKCPVHGDKTDYFSNEEPDENWAEASKRLNDWLTRVEQDGTDIPQVETKVVFRDDQYYVHAWDVWPVARRRLNDSDLLRVGQQVFEVLGYVERDRQYLVRPFSMELSDEDLRRLADGS
jgi:hypothetical protein